MAKTAVSELYKYAQKILTLTGVWPYSDATLFYRIWGFGNLFLYVILTVLSFVEICITFNGIESVSYSLFITLAVLSYIPRPAILFYNRHEFYRILENLKLAILETYDDSFDFYIAKRVKLITLLQLAFQVMVVMSVTMTGFITSETLPMPLPFGLTRPPKVFFPVLWLLQIYTLNMAGLNNSSLDIVVCSFMAIGAAHLEILREKLKRVAEMSFNSRNSAEYLELYGRDGEGIMLRIQNCVQHHIAIEELIKSTEKTFTYIFLVQFLGSLVIICCNGFTFVILPVASVQFGISLLFIVVVTVQLFIYCAYGNDVMMQSSKIGEACYMSEWNNCQSNVRKCLFIIMERSKRPFILTAGKFTPLTLSSFLMMMKSSFSYFTVLQKLYTKISAEQ